MHSITKTAYVTALEIRIKISLNRKCLKIHTLSFFFHSNIN